MQAALGYARIDASESIAAGHDQTSRDNTLDRDNTSRDNTIDRDNTSRDNNRDTNARQDRGTTERQGASDAAVYRSVYAAYLKAKPKDVVGATAAARAAVSGVQQGTPRADIPSGDPLAGGGNPAPRGGGGRPKPAARPAGPVRVSSPEQARKLPKGTHFITPDGRELVA
jgi:hypothetical protein